ncbi:hypothetical protein PIB30_047634 [Stylosanthes scabra]|uniref:Uncharacterized protein n=1 Tax=Stylosanthes scabra TaxID=79078 RepID=A0ABU6TGH1_9FABA|nr:hypothetical protein [Stylosanthes scabra]
MILKSKTIVLYIGFNPLPCGAKICATTINIHTYCFAAFSVQFNATLLPFSPIVSAALVASALSSMLVELKTKDD